MQNRWTDIVFSLIRKIRINYLKDNLRKKACAFDVFFIKLMPQQKFVLLIHKHVGVEKVEVALKLRIDVAIWKCELNSTMFLTILL
ncbi:hypothetical protein ACO0LC_04455 [Undibacterium sp. JH2W]|uniref:hypothetical protein n=1 Tax=Undibacterium sp. JH2W TaxID=3413037 RepID=UPI003BF41B08